MRRLILVLLAGIIVALASGAARQAVRPEQYAVMASNRCLPLSAPGGASITVSNVAQLANAVNSATPGTTIRIADGVYNLDGVYLRFDVPNVTLRSASGIREAVVLDGNYLTTEIIQIVASGVTIADLTLREAYYHPIHVIAEDSANTLNTTIYNLHIIDPGEQAIKINNTTSGFYVDDGVIACSHIELTNAGRSQIRNNCYTGGIDAHQARNWTIRDNIIEGFWCSSGLSEHGIHLWRGSRDTIVERNLLRNNARGIGFGLVTSGPGRTYGDNACPAASGYVDHYGGVIRNNMVYAGSAALFGSEYGFDCGICLANACAAAVLNNTVYATQAPFSSIEWRFANTSAAIINNLVNHPMRERDGASATQSHNLTNAPANWFVDAAAGNLHLLPAATNAINQALPQAGVRDDFDGDSRPFGSAPDIGADELIPLAIQGYLPLVRR